MSLIAGVDEVGRGPLAGPVVAGAVVLPEEHGIDGLRDSKKLTRKKREALYPVILSKALGVGIGEASVEKIDEINILNASFLAMHKAIKKLKVNPDFLIMDGNRFSPYRGIQHECIIKGDGKYLSIAAASALAKNYRDEIMKELDAKLPEYKWKNNKGYPTKEHRNAIQNIGISKYHRKSFQLLPSQLSLAI